MGSTYFLSEVIRERQREIERIDRNYWKFAHVFEGSKAPTRSALGNVVAILSRVLEPDKPSLLPEAARALLALDFNQADKDRMRQLSAKAREGTLSPDEQAEADSYERVGHILNIIQSKARQSLKSRHGTNGQTKPH